MGYRPWGHKESDTTECLSTHAEAQQLWHTGLVAPWHVESSQTKDQTHVPSLLENGMATHSSILAWRILWTEEPGRL